MDKSRPPVPTRVSRFTRARSQPCATARTACARRDLNPQHPASRAGLSATLEYEHLEPPPGADPDHPPYEGGPQPWRRPGWGTKTRTWNLLIQSQMCCLITPFPIACGRRESNAHGPCGPAGFEPAAATVTPLPPGAPPRPRTLFPGVRVRCITSHACGAYEPHRGIEPRSPAWKAGASPQCL